jgi:hypothetical protein
VRFIAVVFSVEGTPLKSGRVDLVIPEGDTVAAIGRGVVAEGGLDITAEAGPVWGLLINGQPVVAFPAAVKGDTVDLGEINLLAQGVACPAFHARDGRVFGHPFTEKLETALPAPSGETPPTQPPTEPAPTLPGDGQTLPRDTIPREPVALRTGLTFSGLVGSTAQQLGAVTALKSGFNLTGASVRVKGVPTVSEDAIGLDFPNAELAATGAGLSEISFTMRPPADTAPPVVEPAGTTVPDLLGYARELATRKLAAMSLLSDVSSVIVEQAAQEGRIVRQVPGAGTTAAPGTVVRLFVGKRGGV